MARRAFFSFQFSEDNWRANVVRNSWVTQERKDAGFFDSVEWEEVKKKTDTDIKKWIDEQMNGCSVTVVLVGSKTGAFHRSRTNLLIYRLHPFLWCKIAIF